MVSVRFSFSGALPYLSLTDDVIVIKFTAVIQN